MSLPRKLGKSSLERDANRLKTLSTSSVEDPLITGDIQPKATDTHDIGTSTLLYRKLYASEIDALIFAQNVISLIGGWLFITKGEGSVNEDVNTTETEIDFGSGASIAQDDFLLFRAAGKVEYMSADNNVAGDLWDVTRNLDGSGANAWPKGTPYANLGYNGDGRIELNAYDTPRIQMIRQGAVYNSQSEHIRIGDLDGNWGYVAETWGVAIGVYGAARSNITSDPTNGIRIRQHSTTHIQLDADGDIFIGEDISAAATTNIAIFTNAQTYNGESVGAGDFLIGDNSASKANIFWDKSAGKLRFRGGQTMQVEIHTSGELRAGGGVLILDSTGVGIDVTTAYNDIRKYRFMSGVDITAEFAGYQSASVNVARILVQPVTGKDSWATVLAQSPIGEVSRAYLIANAGGEATTLELVADDDTNVWYAVLDRDLRIATGLYVGGVGTDPDTDDVWCDGEISTDGGTTKWNLGGYTGGAPTADGYVTVVIEGTTYQVLVNQV